MLCVCFHMCVSCVCVYDILNKCHGIHVWSENNHRNQLYSFIMWVQGIEFRYLDLVRGTFTHRFLSSAPSLPLKYFIHVFVLCCTRRRIIFILFCIHRWHDIFVLKTRTAHMNLINKEMWAQSIIIIWMDFCQASFGEHNLEGLL